LLVGILLVIYVLLVPLFFILMLAKWTRPVEPNRYELMIPQTIYMIVCTFILLRVKWYLIQPLTLVYTKLNLMW
jgi:hypothetical protein